MPSENTKKHIGKWLALGLWVTKIKFLGSSIPLSHWQLQEHRYFFDHLLTSC